MHIKFICKIHGLGKEKIHVWLMTNRLLYARTQGHWVCHFLSLASASLSPRGQYCPGVWTESLTDKHLSTRSVQQTFRKGHFIPSKLFSMSHAQKVCPTQQLTWYGWLEKTAWCLLPPTEGRLILPLPMPLLKILTNVNSANLIQGYHCRTHEMSCCKKGINYVI